MMRCDTNLQDKMMMMTMRWLKRYCKIRWIAGSNIHSMLNQEDKQKINLLKGRLMFFFSFLSLMRFFGVFSSNHHAIVCPFPHFKFINLQTLRWISVYKTILPQNKIYRFTFIFFQLLKKRCCVIIF